MPKREREKRISRYSTERACLNIETAMGRSRPKLTNRAVAAGIEMDETLFSRKLNMSRSTFTLEELGSIADFFNAPAGSGWPVQDADVRKVGP